MKHTLKCSPQCKSEALYYQGYEEWAFYSLKRPWPCDNPISLVYEQMATDKRCCYLARTAAIGSRVQRQRENITPSIGYFIRFWIHSCIYNNIVCHTYYNNNNITTIQCSSLRLKNVESPNSKICQFGIWSTFFCHSRKSCVVSRILYLHLFCASHLCK